MINDGIPGGLGGRGGTDGSSLETQGSVAKRAGWEDAVQSGSQLKGASTSARRRRRVGSPAGRGAHSGPLPDVGTVGTAMRRQNGARRCRATGPDGPQDVAERAPGPDGPQDVAERAPGPDGPQDVAESSATRRAATPRGGRARACVYHATHKASPGTRPRVSPGPGNTNVRLAEWKGPESDGLRPSPQRAQL